MYVESVYKYLHDFRRLVDNAASKSKSELLYQIKLTAFLLFLSHQNLPQSSYVLFACLMNIVKLTNWWNQSISSAEPF
jgi:hypothetical protein